MTIALRRFELKHQQLPASLDEAFQDADAGSVPDDPYFDEPIKYRVVNGNIQVYSRGIDQKDDAGEMDWDFGRKPGDVILEIPTVAK